MTTLIEAAKQALEALENLFGIPDKFNGGGGDVAVWRLGGSQRAQQAITALRQAIAEAEEQEPVGYFSVNDYGNWEQNESGHGEPFYTTPPEAQPAPVQEPVAWMDGYRNIYSLEEKAAGCEEAVIPLVPAIQHWSDCAVYNEPAYPKGDCDCGGYTTPPASQRQWVGLTDEDLSVCDEDGVILARYWEAKLREKNT